MAAYRLALVASVLLMMAWPTLAFSDAHSGTRDHSATIVNDADGFTGLTQVVATLSVLNSYTADSFTITHKHVTSTSMSITATITGGPGFEPATGTAQRIQLVSGSGDIASAGGSLTFRVQDTTPVHAPCDCDVVVLIEASVIGTGLPDPPSTSSFSRTMDVNV